MKLHDGLISSGAVAHALGISLQAVGDMVRRRALKPKKVSARGWRLFDPMDVARLMAVRNLRRRGGLTVGEALQQQVTR